MSLIGPPLAVQKRQLALMRHRQARMDAERTRLGLTKDEYQHRLGLQARRAAKRPRGRYVRGALRDPLGDHGYVGDVIQVVPDGVAFVRYHQAGHSIVAPVSGNLINVHIAPWHGTGFAWLNADHQEVYKGSRFPQVKR